MINVWINGYSLSNNASLAGGWVAIIRVDDQECILSGSQPGVTNNQMDLVAAIQVLKYFTNPQKMVITTDSIYLKGGMTKWLDKWETNGFTSISKLPIKNQHLWEVLSELRDFHDIEWKWVRALGRCKENREANKMARELANELQKTLY